MLSNRTDLASIRYIMRGQKYTLGILVFILSAGLSCGTAAADCWTELHEKHVQFESAMLPGKGDPVPEDIQAARRQLRNALRKCPPNAEFAKDYTIISTGVDSHITLLDLAILADDVAMTEAMLERLGSGEVSRIDPSNLDYGGRYLEIAAFVGSVDVVKMLLERGFDPNKSNDLGVTPLHVTLAPGTSGLIIIRNLVTHGADIERRTNRNITPMMIARLMGDLAKAQCLLALGASVPDDHAYDGLRVDESRQNSIAAVDDFLKSPLKPIPASITEYCSLEQ